MGKSEKGHVSLFVSLYFIIWRVCEFDVQVIKNEGWERLYGGLTPSLVGTAASQVKLLAGLVYFFE